MSRDLSEIRYIAVFVPIRLGGLNKAESWIVEGISVRDIDLTCKIHHARAEVFDLEDAARMRRLVLIPAKGISPGEVYQLKWAEQRRAEIEQKATAWEHLLRDEF